MCMVEDADGMALVFGARSHKAIKQHRCGECRRVIEAGECYLVERVIYDHEASTHKTCAHCQCARAWLTAECGGWCFTGIAEDIAEHHASGHYGFGVSRLAAGMRTKWRRRDGRLRPVPRMPKTTHERVPS